MRFMRITVDNIQLAKKAFESVSLREVNRLNRDFFSDPANYFFVIENEKGIIGYLIGYELLRPDSPKKQLLIDHLEISEIHRQKGYGKELLHLIMDIFHDIKVDRVFLLADKINTPALKLYDSVLPEITQREVLNQFIYQWNRKE